MILAVTNQIIWIHIALVRKETEARNIKPQMAHFKEFFQVINLCSSDQQQIETLSTELEFYLSITTMFSNIEIAPLHTCVYGHVCIQLYWSAPSRT